MKNVKYFNENEGIIFDKLKIEEIESVREILLQVYGGEYPSNWDKHFITDERCFAFGLYDNGILSAVLLSEKLSLNGCILWYIAVKLDKQSKKYGSILLCEYEKYIKSIGITWIFLNATKNSLEFYKKHNYTISNYQVFEHIKKL